MGAQDVIDSFTGEHRFLSNFELSPISVRIDGQDLQGSTVEHVYQALKTNNASDRIKVLSARTPGGAKKLGKELKMREDWDKVKVKYMRALVLAKFQQNPRLAAKLLGTGNAELIEGNWWGDRFWGVCRGSGQNQLGKILMWVRAELRRRAPEPVNEPVVGAVADESEGEADPVGESTATAEVTTPTADVSASAPSYEGPWAVLDRYLDEVSIYSLPWQWINHALYREVCLLPGIVKEIISRMERGDIHWPFFSILKRLTNYDATKAEPVAGGGFVAVDVMGTASAWVEWYRNKEDPSWWNRKESGESPQQESSEESA